MYRTLVNSRMRVVKFFQYLRFLLLNHHKSSHFNVRYIKSKNLRIWKNFTTLILELTKVLYIFQTSYGNVSIWHTFWVLPQQYTRDTTGTSQI